jgi:hypothetical protein
MEEFQIIVPYQSNEEEDLALEDDMRKTKLAQSRNP